MEHMRFRVEDAIHLKGTKSWFLNPPAYVEKIGRKQPGYWCRQGGDFYFHLSHSEARKWEVVLRKEENGIWKGPKKGR